jgi:alpha-glucosidase
MPLFVKAGAVIPNYDKIQYVEQRELSEEMILHVYYSDQVVSSSLYEDAGDHYGYKNGLYNDIRFKQTSDKQHFELRKKFFGQYKAAYRRHNVQVHGLPFKATQYIVDGKTYKLNQNNFAAGVVKIVVDRSFEILVIK